MTLCRYGALHECVHVDNEPVLLRLLNSCVSLCDNSSAALYSSMPCSAHTDIGMLCSRINVIVNYILSDIKRE